DLLSADLNRVPVAQAALALYDLDLVLLHQELDALVKLADDAVTACGDALVLVRHAVGVDAELLPARRDAVVQLRRFQQRLGGDAADVQACAAQLVGFDKRDLQTELGRPDGRGVPAHA